MIEINNLTTSVVSEEFLKVVARTVLKGENTKEPGLSVALVNSEKIKKLNKKYRGKDKTTDVLSFSQAKNFPALPKNELGQVIICLQEVKKNAKKYNIEFKKELARVLIHGILHLLGYEHEKNEKEAKKMEEYYLSQII